MNSLDATDLALLRCIYQFGRATVYDLRTHALAKLSRTHVYRKLARLEEAGYLSSERLMPERGHGSPRVYRLLLKGARALGIASLSSAQYRKQTREVYQAQHVRQELAIWAARQRWRLLTTDEECRRVLSDLLTHMGYARYGEHFPTHTVVPVNLKVRPDLLLDTGKVLVLVIVGHPQASATFWKKRLERYEPVLHALRVACFALTELQYRDAAEVLATTRYAKRCLLLHPFQVEELVTRLARE
jgi:DNA-binding PadR family transcriptional regulator